MKKLNRETIVVKDIDVRLLKQQRNQFLLMLRDEKDDEKRLYLTEKEINALKGVINLLDYMLDNSSDNK